MTPNEIYRFAIEWPSQHKGPPSFEGAERFSYDTFMHGTPTTAKLATEAAGIAAYRCQAVNQFHEWPTRPLRFHLWRDDGQPYGSIEVELQFNPMVTPLGGTLKRATDYAA